MTARSTSIALIVAALAAIVFAQLGFQGVMFRDNAIYLYSGQQFAAGVPPYLSVSDMKMPLGSFIAGVGVVSAQVLGLDDVFVVRIVFFLIACGAVVAVFFMGRAVFCDHWVSLFAALAFIGFSGFAIHAVSGPRPKVAMVLFEVLCLLFAVRRRWFVSAMFASLSFLVWQPMAAYVGVVLLLAVLQPDSREERSRAVGLTIAGGLLPVIAVTAYFVLAGGLREFLGDTILFFFQDFERRSLVHFSIARRVARPFVVIFQAYGNSLVTIAAGFIGLTCVFVRHLRQAGSPFWAGLFRSRFSVLFVSIPAPVLWSFVDFQGAPDLFVVLPYLALGFGWLMERLLTALVARVSMSRIGGTMIRVTICMVLVVLPSLEYRNSRDTGLLTQRRDAERVAGLAPKDATILALEAPEVLCFLHRTNPTRYVVVNSGVHNLMADEYVDGVDGWLAEMRDLHSDVVVFRARKMRPRWLRKSIQSWLKSEFESQVIGDWEVYSRGRVADRRE